MCKAAEAVQDILIGTAHVCTHYRVVLHVQHHPMIHTSVTTPSRITYDPRIAHAAQSPPTYSAQPGQYHWQLQNWSILAVAEVVGHEAVAQVMGGG